MPKENPNANLESFFSLACCVRWLGSIRLIELSYVGFILIHGAHRKYQCNTMPIGLGCTLAAGYLIREHIVQNENRDNTLSPALVVFYWLYRKLVIFLKCINTTSSNWKIVVERIGSLSEEVEIATNVKLNPLYIADRRDEIEFVR